MAYFTPYIDETGIHIPTYEDVLQHDLDEMRKIHGPDINLEPDNPDYQVSAMFARVRYDNFYAHKLVFNSYRINTAMGTGLDSLVKLNGIKRKGAGYSTVQLTLTGTVGSVINNGVARDDSGNLWVLDDAKIVFTAESLKVYATCNKIGAIEASPYSITAIQTPTKGWLTVTNEAPATPGVPIETDKQLKARYSLSTAIASKNTVDALRARLLALDGVTAVKIYDNDTWDYDSNGYGIPPKTVCCVVNYTGSKEVIAQQIYECKGLGGTYGDGDNTVIITTDSGLPEKISFFRPSLQKVKVQLNLMPSVNLTLGAKQETEQRIIDAITNYFANIEIGMNIIPSLLISVASQAITDIYNPEFTIKQVLSAKDGGTLSTAPTTIDFYERAKLLPPINIVWQ